MLGETTLNSRQILPLPAGYDAQHVREMAVAFLEAVASGQPSEEHAAALATRVAAKSEFRLALTVLAGGPHVEARAIELAELVLSDGGASELSAQTRTRTA